MSPELRAGATYDVAMAPVDLPAIVRYAGASGDFNPMHYDRDLAQSGGFPANFAQGMLTAGISAAAISDRYGPRALRAFGVRFVSQLWCGDAPRLKLVVESADGDEARVGFTVDVDDRVVLKGWARIDMQLAHQEPRERDDNARVE
jgi:acyl dehydratase